MTFDIDKQTIKDLELFPEKRNDKSILSIYSNTATIGGRDSLYQVFSNPSSNLEYLQNRKIEIHFFVANDCPAHERNLQAPIACASLNLLVT